MMRPSARCELKHVFGLRLINSNGLDLFLQFENFVSVGHCKSAVRPDRTDVAAGFRDLSSDRDSQRSGTS